MTVDYLCNRMLAGQRAKPLGRERERERIFRSPRRLSSFVVLIGMQLINYSLLDRPESRVLVEMGYGTLRERANPKREVIFVTFGCCQNHAINPKGLRVRNSNEK